MIVSQVRWLGSITDVGPSAAEEPHELTNIRPTASATSKQRRLATRLLARSVPARCEPNGDVPLTNLEPVACVLFETVCMLVETSQIPYWFQIY